MSAPPAALTYGNQARIPGKMVSGHGIRGTVLGMETQPATTADLINQATTQISTLVRDELALAKAELTEKGKRAGVGGGMLGGAGVLSLYGLGLLIALAVVALDIVWP